MATFNFTGRQDIDKSAVQLGLREDNGRILLDVHSISVSDLGLPPSAEVAVEAYRQTTKVRISCGSIAALCYPKDVQLDAFDVIDNIGLRLRIVGTEGSSHGKVLAVADRLRLSGNDDAGSSEPLLKMQRTDLGERVWKFGLDNFQPILYINKSLENHLIVVQSPLFRALVLPEFFRHVALWIAQKREDANDPDSTISHWLLFCDSIGVDLADLDSLADSDEGTSDLIDEWATNAASAFADHFGALSLLNGASNPEEDEEDNA